MAACTACVSETVGSSGRVTKRSIFSSFSASMINRAGSASIDSPCIGTRGRRRCIGAAAAPVSADIAQDRKRCQFAFLLDEKPTVVSVGMVAGLSIKLFDKQAHRERIPGTSKQLD